MEGLHNRMLILYKAKFLQYNVYESRRNLLPHTLIASLHNWNNKHIMIFMIIVKTQQLTRIRFKYCVNFCLEQHKIFFSILAWFHAKVHELMSYVHMFSKGHLKNGSEE